MITLAYLVIALVWIVLDLKALNVLNVKVPSFSMDNVSATVKLEHVPTI